VNFLAGEKVKHTVREREGVFVQALSAELALVDFGYGHERASLKHLALVIAKRTPFMHILATDPSALCELAANIKEFGGRIEVSTSPQVLEKAADRLSANSSLSPTEAVDYIKVCSEKSHSTKYDIMVMSATFPPQLAARLGVILKKAEADAAELPIGKRAYSGEWQISSNPLAEYLLREHDILPKRVTK
jgi:hypothetical protein